MKARIDQYRKDRKNKFSSTEAMMVALLCPDLYPELMPKKYRNDPVGAQMKLDHRQREYVWNRRLGICPM
jgi:hypothetical protein